jgi:NADH-quinone oxidoreductase subunit J
LDTETLNLVLFLAFGLVALGGGALVIINRNPVYSALNLVLTLFAVSALYVLLGAYFVAAVQVVVYAGAVVVLFLFVIMLLNLGNQEALREAFRPRVAIAGVLGAVFLVAAGATAWQAVGPLRPAAPDPAFAHASHTERIGRLLFENYLLPFEVTSVILLGGLVGVVVLVRFHGRPDRRAD